MSLEQAIEKLTAAVEANTAALKGGTGSTKASGKASGGETAYKPKHSKEDMQSALGELKEKSGGSEAPKKIIKEVGGVDKMAEITDPAVIDKVYEAAKAAVAALDEGM
jgi:hypothetical protein